MARDSSGTHSLPAGQPVVTGTTITSSAFNVLTDDISDEITDSLSRSGKGGMSAALRLADGTAGTPAVAFTNDTAVGIYRSASGEASIVAGSTAVAKWTSASFFASLVQAVTAVGIRILGRVADGASAVGVILDNSTTLSTAGAKILSIRNNTAEKAYFDLDGYLCHGGSAIRSPVTVYLSADRSTTSNSMQNVTDLSYAIVANGIYVVEGLLRTTCGGATDQYVDFSGPASPTLVEVSYTFERAADAVHEETSSSGTAFTSSAGFVQRKANSSINYMRWYIENGANAGTIQLRQRNQDGVSTVTVSKGSILRITRVA